MYTASRPGRNAFLPLLIVIAVLYVGREFLIPVALALLISFLLVPLIRKLEGWHFGRVGAVIAATAVSFLAIGIAGYIVAGQLLDLANELPKYRTNLHHKVLALKAPKDGPLARATETLREISGDLSEDSGKPGAEPGNNQPVPVEVKQAPANGFETLKGFVTPVLEPLGMTAVVIIFVIFMLLAREDLRDRFIHLMGRGHLQLTTVALDEVAYRVSRYLLAQLMVNTAYGVLIGIGLYFIGVPNAVLWGLLSAVLRFVPYVGAWMAAAFPLLLTVAISPTWTMTLLALGLFVLVEIITYNVVEPWLYGSSTGLAPMTIIVAATFWTWLWGGIGLLLATPLTVCIAVLGKYIPALSFLDVLLGEKPPIAAEDRFYQRLLAVDEEEVAVIAETYVEEHSLAEAFDRLIIPALRLADEDYHRGQLPEADWRKLLGVTRDLVTDLGDLPKPENDGAAVPTVDHRDASVFCLPASDEADEVISLMLAKLLEQSGVTAEVLSVKLLASELMEKIAEDENRHICISILPPNSTRQAIYYCKRLRERFATARISVGLWGEPEGDERRTKRLQRARPDVIFTTLQDAVKEIASTAPVAPPVVAVAEPAGVPAMTPA